MILNTSSKSRNIRGEEATAPTMSVLLLLVLLAQVALGHVRLNFPEGRDLTLDFLDSVRTRPPCGMPRGEPKTTLQAGRELNVTWHLSYPHQGEWCQTLLVGGGSFLNKYIEARS